MKVKVEETRNFRVEIPLSEVRKLLIKAGYDIPKDARLWMWDHQGFSTGKLIASWDRKQ